MLAAITVNTLTDGFDLSDGLISLREAIVATNINAAFGDSPAGDVDGDSIRIDPTLAGQTIALSSGQLEITDDLIIRGFGTIVEAAPNERIFSINTSEVVSLSRLTLENGDASQGGAIRFQGGGTLRLFRSQFFDNSAQLGGAIYAAGGNISFFESIFSNNRALGDASAGTIGAGGGLHLADQSATVVILGSAFEGNVAERGNGGAISAGESDQVFAFADTNFRNNTSSDAGTNGPGNGGGAIYSEGLVRVGRSAFTNNVAADGSGGAIYAGGRRVVVANTSFENNHADIFGGAVNLESGITTRFINSRFSNNESTNDFSRGGALHVADPVLDANGFLVDPDEPPSRLEIRSSFFFSNRSQAGGAIYLSGRFAGGHHALISDTFFSGNSVSGTDRFSFSTGGAIHSTGDLQIYNSTFNNNEARHSSFGSLGGAVYSTDAELEIALSSFSGNDADFGGAVAIEEFFDVSDLTIFESEFRNNRAGLPVGDPRIPPTLTEPFGDGGAIYLRSTFTFPVTTFRIAGGLFEANIGTNSGGAVAASVGAAKLVVVPGPNGATQFIGNRALAGDGGAISTSLTTNIRDAVFSENTARNGAGIFMGGPAPSQADLFPVGQLTLSGAQITENAARISGGGVFVTSGVAFVNSSSNISSNTANNGDDIFEEQSTPLLLAGQSRL